MTIRPITAADRAAYLTFAGEFYASPAVLAPVPESYFARTFDTLMSDSPYTAAYIFEQEQQAVGYALLSRTYSQEAGGEVIWIEELYLRPAFRHQGGGHAFFRYLMEHTHAARYRLEVEPENEGAVRLYRAMGFHPLPYGQMIRDNPPECD